ncbi:hypothetical protein QYF61_007462 [Mycteria americana]|uniref:Integrase catalytic domain-containing protein n=1 Tax=Mycteria americana TaxID=33587 RepID=A0AAN7RNB8_MYCAM|nr:hypothetical protein QYF61_007462 [Mycteria americana]
MFKGRVPSTHHATDATWSKWVALITQWAQIGNPNGPGILEVIMDWPEGKDFGISPEEEQRKQNNWQRRGKPIWAAALWQDIAVRVENLVVKVHHVDANIPKGQATEEHQNNQQVDQAAQMEVSQVDLHWQHKGKRYVLTMVEATTGWLETYPVPHATSRNTILGLEKQVLWRHGTPERIESDNGTHFRNNLIDTWAKEHGIEWLQQ